MRFRLFLFLIALLAVPALPSYAQFSTEPEIMPVTPGFGMNNPALRHILELQEQNQLLRKLIEREQSVNNMVTAAVSVGIASPFVPSPDQLLCGAVPGNIPCAQAFPALYDDFSMTPQKAPPPLPPAASLVSNADIPALDPNQLSELPEQPAIETSSLMTGQIYWTDITCLGNNCSAVISNNPADPKTRFRVVAGEKLPDGSIVRAISYIGVTLERDKKTIQLEPAPSA